jgi:hypothetical protein
MIAGHSFSDKAEYNRPWLASMLWMVTAFIFVIGILITPVIR